MWYPARVTIAGTEPITAAEVKTHLNASAMSDATANRLVKTERGFIEKYCGIFVAAQTVAANCDCFADFVRLPIAPVNSVSAVSYVDADGTTQTLPSTVYELRADGLVAAIVLKYGQAWPSVRPGSRITLTATVGWATVPDELVSAILLRLGRLNALSKSDPLLRRRVIEGVGSREWDASGALEQSMTRAVADLLENYRCFPS